MTKNFKSSNLLVEGYTCDNEMSKRKIGSVNEDGSAHFPCTSKRFEESDDFN
jgi:hypothetical protein